MKKCNWCDEEFQSKTGNQVFCSIKCRNCWWSNDYYQKNKDKILESNKTPEYRQRANVLAKSEPRSLHRLKYLKERRKTDAVYRVKVNIAERLKLHFGKEFKVGKLEYYLGYKIIDLRNHLISTIPDGYCITHYLAGKMHLDHIIPYHWFIVMELGDQEFKKCWNPINLRLIPKEKNLKRIRKTFDWMSVKKYGLENILPKGADQIWREQIVE